jgi:hypothetical protein
MRIVGITKTLKDGLFTKVPTQIAIKYDDFVPPGQLRNNRGFVALLGPKDEMRPFVFRTWRTAGFFDLQVHADPTKLWAKLPNGDWKALSTKAVAALLTHQKGFQAKGCVGLRLFACSAGNSDRCHLGGLIKIERRTVAEELAILTGKPVVAPVDTLFTPIGKNGFLDIQVSRAASDPPLAKGWKIFLPVKDHTGKVVRVDIKWFDWQGRDAP